MAKSISSYEQDIQDTLNTPESLKHAKKIAKQMKSLQREAFASESFKVSLKTRLADIHSIDNSVERVPKLYILRNFMMFCSFFFISGVLLFVLNSRDEALLAPIQYDTKITQDIKTEEENDIGDVDMHTEETTRSNSEVENTQEIQEENEASFSPKGEENQGLGNTKKTQKENIQSLPEAMIDESSAMSSSMMMDDAAMLEADMPPETVGNAGMRSEESEEYEDSQAIYEFYRVEFYEICEVNNGVVQDDEYTCKFDDGGLCTIDNIQENSSEPCAYLYEINKN